MSRLPTVMLGLLLLFAAGVAASAEPVPPRLTLAGAIEICRITFFVDNARGKAMFDALPEEEKPLVAAVCIGYRQGAEDILEALHKKPDRSS